MDKKVRAKFKCHTVEQFEQSENVKLGAQYDPTAPEDEKFSLYTPYGELVMGVSNPALIGHFKTGKTYYIDITEASE